MNINIERLLGEPITKLELKASGACNDAYYVETESGKRLIVKQEREVKEFQPQNTLLLEANIINALSSIGLSVPIPKIRFVAESPDMFAYDYIDGDLLINVWKDLSEKERIEICEALGKFHAEIGRVFTKEEAEKTGMHINSSTRLHPEVEKEYNEILTFADIPTDIKDLAKRAKSMFDQTLELGIFQFVHNDAHHENILIKDKKIAGIIDFGESEYGEVAKEFSRYTRDFPDYVEYIIQAYEKASGNTLSRERVFSNAFLSGLIDNIELYREGGESRIRAEKNIGKYKDLLGAQSTN